MEKQDNTFLLAAGVILAAVVLSKSDSGKKDTPKYSPQFVKGGALEFITKMYPYALKAHQSFPKIPYELFLSFSALESGFGKHAPEWNFFGTKTGKGYTGKKQLLETHEILPKRTGYNFPQVISVMDSVKYPNKFDWHVKDYFRAYNSPLDAFLDFGAFISRGCYKKAADVPYINQKLQELKNCGYATDPNYVAKQMKIVNLIQEAVKKFA